MVCTAIDRSMDLQGACSYVASQLVSRTLFAVADDKGRTSGRSHLHPNTSPTKQEVLEQMVFEVVLRWRALPIIPRHSNNACIGGGAAIGTAQTEYRNG